MNCSKVDSDIRVKSRRVKILSELPHTKRCRVNTVWCWWRTSIVAALTFAAIWFPNGEPAIGHAQERPALRPSSETVKIGLILSLSGRLGISWSSPYVGVDPAGTTREASRIMRNSAEMAAAEHVDANVQLLIKDDFGNDPGVKLAARQAIEEGAQIILGPLLSELVTSAKPITTARSVPMIAFSTDSRVASHGAYLLSFLPESDVDAIVTYAISQHKRSFIGLFPGNSYGAVLEREFREAVTNGGGRLVAVHRYGDAKSIAEIARSLTAPGAPKADALFLPDATGAIDLGNSLVAHGADLHKYVVLGTQGWDNPTIFSDKFLQGAWYPAPDPGRFLAFSERYRNRYHEKPPRFAMLAYDAVAMIAALARTRRSQGITDEMLTDSTGFSGVRRHVSLPYRWHKPTWTCDLAYYAIRRPNHLRAAA